MARGGIGGGREGGGSMGGGRASGGRMGGAGHGGMGGGAGRGGMSSGAGRGPLGGGAAGGRGPQGGGAVGGRGMGAGHGLGGHPAPGRVGGAPHPAGAGLHRAPALSPRRHFGAPPIFRAAPFAGMVLATAWEYSQYVSLREALYRLAYGYGTEEDMYLAERFFGRPLQTEEYMGCYQWIDEYLRRW